MARRDQPYLPLYVQDFMTDEKLSECSAMANGVYIRLMCLMHKSEQYGVVLLKQKDWQNSSKEDSKVLAFAKRLQRNMPYDLDDIKNGLQELLDEDVVQIEGNELRQKRMVKDAELSAARSEAGKKGGVATAKTKAIAKEFATAKTTANSEIEIEDENITDTPVEGGTGGEEPPDILRLRLEPISVLSLADCRRAFWYHPHCAASKQLVIEQVTRRMKQPPDQTSKEMEQLIGAWSEVFNQTLTARTVQSRSIGEWCSHFSNWLNTTDLNSNPQKYFDKQPNTKPNATNSAQPHKGKRPATTAVIPSERDYTRGQSGNGGAAGSN